MKKKLTNAACVLAIVAGLAAAAVAPWWAVWLICLPVIWAAAVKLIGSNTDWIWKP